MFNYDEAKAKYGAQRARQMEQDANKPAPPPASTTPPAPAPPAPAPAPAGGAPRPPAPAPAPAPAAPSPYGDVSGFKTFADWQSAYRAAGGTGQNTGLQDWYNKQTSGGAPPPNAPANGQPPAPQAPAAPGGGGSAQQYLDSFSPADQTAIKNSFAGNPNGLQD